MALKQCHPDLSEKTHLLDEVSISGVQSRQHHPLDFAPQQAYCPEVGGPQQSVLLHLRQNAAELPANSIDHDFYSSSTSAGFVILHDFSSLSASVETSPTQLFSPPQAITSVAYGAGSAFGIELGLGIGLSPMDGSAPIPDRRYVASGYAGEQAHPRPSLSQPNWQ